MTGGTVSHYRILEKLGEGGMGVVYKALDLKLERFVALKFLPAQLGADPEKRQRFIHEAKAASALEHPNICTIHEIDETPDGQLFIAMAYLEGETLKAKIERGPLGIAEATDLAMQVARGLAKAHSNGIVHRDIKPANVIVTNDGVATIVDFGLAKLAGGTEITRTGTTLGTAAYMSPEQAQGMNVDARSDVWALGVVLYEMLSGERPFRGQHLAEVVFSVVNSKVRPLREQRPEIPPELERILERALEKNREVRYASAAGLVAELGAFRDTLSAGRAQPTASPPRKRAARAVALVVVLAAAAVPLYWRQSRIRWARQTALPEVERLIAKGSYLAAFDLAREAERRLGDDPQLAKLWPEMSVALTVETNPPDAEVSLKPYAEPAAPWRNLGRAPLKEVRVPQGSFRFRATKQGHEPAETMALLQQDRTLRLALDPVGAQPGMVHVPAGAFRTILAHFGALGPIELGEYWLDRYEVTNRQFKQFVDAGGYQKPEYWKHPPESFRDSTGRPGPAFWEAGTYPDGQDDYPVTGVSWYEAAAYAAWAGKSLPTLYHWYHAAGVISSADVAPFSNFGGTGLAKSGQFAGLSPSGAYDMAGNVKEWVWNEVDGKRFILGGAWDEPSYIFTWAEFRSPSDRSRQNGFRCVKYGAPPPEALLGPLRTRSRDYAKEKPVSDDVFRIFQSMYAREPAPLQARVEATDTTPEYWTREKVTYAAGYGKQRLAAHLFLPKLGAPPYQAVVFMPGSNALFFRSSDRELWAMPWLDFLVKSGRALVCPVWYGTYERQIGLQVQQHTREALGNWVRDLGATIDYLESRPDFDGARISFLGFSMGARGGIMLTALEPRVKANIWMDGGLPYVTRGPEIDEINFAPRVKTPTLMLNGKYDFIFPAEQTQAPLFRLLGTPEKDKRRVVFETGHNVLALRPQAAKEMLDWLDRYLGPVTRR